MVGVVNDTPVPIEFPPVLRANQFTVSPFVDVAVRIEVPVPHLEDPKTSGGLGNAFTVSKAVLENNLSVHAPFISQRYTLPLSVSVTLFV